MKIKSSERTMKGVSFVKCRYLCLFFLIAGWLQLTSCSSRVPEGVLDEQTMENVLYDYHIARSLAETQSDGTRGADMRYYIQAVWQKYNITEEIFDNSLEWYSRNSELLYKIYQKLDERYARATNSQHKRASMGVYRNGQSNGAGDTINIWKGRDTYLLTSYENNYMTFAWKEDSVLREGDRLLLHLNTSWYYREGARMAALQLNLRYPNDSVVTINRLIHGTGDQDIYINTDRKMRVASVSGLIYQETTWNDRPQLLLISDFSLLRLRDKEPENETER